MVRKNKEIRFDDNSLGEFCPKFQNCMKYKKTHEE